MLSNMPLTAHLRLARHPAGRIAPSAQSPTSAPGGWMADLAEAEPLIAQGAAWSSTAAEAAAQSEFVFSIVGDDSASRAVWTGPGGALAGIAPGALAIECSTLSLVWANELRALARAQDVELV